MRSGSETPQATLATAFPLLEAALGGQGGGQPNMESTTEDVEDIFNFRTVPAPSPSTPANPRHDRNRTEL